MVVTKRTDNTHFEFWNGIEDIQLTQEYATVWRKDN